MTNKQNSAREEQRSVGNSTSTNVSSSNNTNQNKPGSLNESLGGKTKTDVDTNAVKKGK